MANLDYGYDFERMLFEPSAGRSLPSEGGSAKVAADADTTMSADARKLVEIAHNAICVLKAQSPAA